MVQELFLSVNLANTELVLFIKKSKLPAMVIPSLTGTPIKLADKVMYLGIILDKKLNCRKHLQIKLEKVL